MMAAGPAALPHVREGEHDAADAVAVRRRVPLALVTTQLPQDHHLRRFERNPAQHHYARWFWANDGRGGIMKTTYSTRRRSCPRTLRRIQLQGLRTSTRRTIDREGRILAEGWSCEALEPARRNRPDGTAGR